MEHAKSDPTSVLFLKSRVKECPNCGGSCRAGEIPLRDGKRIIGRCSICNGEGVVPEWDYERLLAMVSNNQTSIQTELSLTEENEV